MTRESAKKWLTTIAAYAEGETVQFKFKEGKEWNDFTFGEPKFDEKFDYRIKPTPTYRPWKPEEVPVGALIRTNSKTQEFIIMGRNSNVRSNGYVEISRVNVVLGGWQSFDSADCEYSLDHSKTWLPCGVLNE